LTYDVFIDGHPARVTFNGSDFRFECKERIVEQSASVIEVEPGVYSVITGTRSYEVKLANGHCEIAGRRMSVEVFDPRQMRYGSRGTFRQGPQSVAASMPGRVIRVLVAEGEQVSENQGLVVVEAMKMQNELKAPRAGRVSSLRANEGAAVAAGEMLLTLE
jgi:biotin carboxyl carrier protein